MLILKEIQIYLVKYPFQKNSFRRNILIHVLNHNHAIMVMLEIKKIVGLLPASLRIQTLYNKLSMSAPVVPKLKDWKFPLVPVKYCKQPPGALESVKKNKNI